MIAVCLHCHEPFPLPRGPGRPPKTCSPTCRCGRRTMQQAARRDKGARRLRALEAALAEFGYKKSTNRSAVADGRPREDRICRSDPMEGCK